MWHSDHFLALPADVIAFAWSAPMRDLARTIGISDVGLRKLLTAQGIVTPPQGHWNRVKAGRPVIAPPKPPARRPGENGRIGLDARFRDHVPEAGPMAEAGPFASRHEPEDLAALHARELAAIGKATAPRDLSRAPAALARLLRSEDARRAKLAASRWPSSWDGPQFETPLAQRQLRILAGLFTALARRDHGGEVWHDNGELRARCLIGDQTLRLQFGIVEKHRTELYAGYHRPARDLPAGTPLRLMLDTTLRVPLPTSWEDEADRPLEKQLAEMAAALVVAGEAAFRQGLVDAREHAEKMQRWEEERRRERLAELGRKRLADLRTSGELLRQAEDIRALVERVEAAVLRGGTDDLAPDRVGRWKQWALAQADALDPVLSGQVLSHLSVPELDD